MKLETVKIADEGAEQGFIIINKSDFDEKTMKEFVVKSQEELETEAAEAEAAAEEFRLLEEAEKLAAKKTK